jgi:hypothetical protein
MYIFMDNEALLQDQDPDDDLHHVIEFCKDKIPDVKSVEHYNGAQSAFVLVEVNNPTNHEKLFGPTNNYPKSPAEFFNVLDPEWITASNSLRIENGIGMMISDATPTTLEDFCRALCASGKFCLVNG